MKKILISLVMVSLLVFTAVPVLAKSGSGTGVLNLDSLGVEGSLAVGGTGTAVVEGRGIVKASATTVKVHDIDGDATVTTSDDCLVTVYEDGWTEYTACSYVRVEGSHIYLEADTEGLVGSISAIASGYLSLEGTGWYIYGKNS